MSDEPERDEQQKLLQLYVDVLDTEPDALVRRDCADRLLLLNDDAPLGVTILERVAAIASEKGDTDVHKRVLELLTQDPDLTVKTRALERLGNLFADLGDRRAAAKSWHPAAMLREEAPSHKDDARRLYERVLDTLPDDAQAAERLVHLYADANEWEKIPEVLGVVVRADIDRGAALVLRLEERAYKAGKLDEFVAMVEEAAALAQPLSTSTRRLRRAKARALTENPARHAEAAAMYRELLETFGREDDPREYQSFIEVRPNPRETMWERRWLYQWRARHEDRPADPLIEWAKDEEQYGDRDDVPAIYQRAIEAAPETERPAIALQLVALYERLSRLDDALAALAPLVAMVPPLPAAHDVFRKLLADEMSGTAVIEGIEKIAKTANDETAARLLEALLAAPETASMLDARRRWYRSAIELSQRIPVLNLTTILDGARALPDEESLWDAAERLGTEHGQLDAVVGAYGDVLRAAHIDATLAEIIGKRMMALEGECTVEDFVFVNALEKVLDLAPTARWALDRVKLALGAQERWDALFGLYDRAIAAAKDDEQRTELLREAATAAKDLASNTNKAIAYLEALRAAQPDDAAASGALERLYERANRKLDLVTLLTERSAHADQASRQASRRRIAALSLDLGRIEEASATIEATLADGAVASDLADVLERIVRHRGAERASTGCTRALVGVRVLAAQGPTGVFARALPFIEADIQGDAIISRAAHRSILIRAIAATKHAATDAELDDALRGASRAIDALRARYIADGDTRGASRLLARAARLAFPIDRQRALLEEAALLCSESADDRERALRLFAKVFADQSPEAVPEKVRVRFTDLLVASGEEYERAQAPERALAVYERAAALASEPAFDALARLHAKGEQWPLALPALEWLCARAGLPDDKRTRYKLRLAEALDELGHAERARASLEEILAARPAPDIALEARGRLISIYRGEGEWRALADALSAQAEVTEDLPARAALYADASAVVHDQLKVPVEAAWVLELAITATPQDIELRPRLAAILEELGEWDRVAEVLAEQIGLYGNRRSKERALVHHRLATALMRVSPERAPEALEHLDSAAKMHPTHSGILFDLARSALDAGDLELAEKTYRALLLAFRSGRESGAAFSSTPIFLDLGAIAVRKGEAARAADLFESGLDEALGKGEDGRPFEEALLGIKRHDLLARAVEARVLRTTESTARAAAIRELADLWSNHLAREPELGLRIRRLAEAVVTTLEPKGAYGSNGDGTWEALWSTNAALGDEPAMLTMIRGRIDAIEEGDGSGPEPGKDWLLEATRLAMKLEDFELTARLYGVLLLNEPSAQDEWTKNPKAAWDLGRALERGGRQGLALQLYESIFDARPIQRETVAALAPRLEALGSTRLGDVFEMWIDLDFDSAAKLAPRLVALRDGEGDQAQIIRALEVAWSHDPSNENFLERLVDHYRGSAAHAEVVRLLDAAIAKRPKDAGLLSSRARAKAGLGDDEGAADDLRGIREVDPNHVDVIAEVLTLIASRAEPPEATDYALLLGDVLVRAGRAEHGRVELEAVLKRFPNEAALLEKLAALEGEAGEWGQAADTQARLVSALEGASPVDAAAVSRAAVALADACEKAGRPDDARGALERALAAEPGNDALTRRMETICEAAGDTSGLCELLLARAARMTSLTEKTTLVLRVANLLIEIGRTPDAIRALNDVVAKNAGKRSQMLATVYLTLGKAHLAGDELLEAFDALKAGITIDARSGELAMLLGLLSIDLGDEKTAERSLVAVVTIASRASGKDRAVDSVTALYHLASMAHAQGDGAKARRWVGKALAEDPSHEPSLALLGRLDAAKVDAIAGAR